MSIKPGSVMIGLTDQVFQLANDEDRVGNAVVVLVCGHAKVMYESRRASTKKTACEICTRARDAQEELEAAKAREAKAKEPETETVDVDVESIASSLQALAKAVTTIAASQTKMEERLTAMEEIKTRPGSVVVPDSSGHGSGTIGSPAEPFARIG